MPTLCDVEIPGVKTRLTQWYLDAEPKTEKECTSKIEALNDRCGRKDVRTQWATLPAFACHVRMPNGCDAPAALPTSHQYDWFTDKEARDETACLAKEAHYNKVCKKPDAIVLWADRPKEACWGRMPTGCSKTDLETDDGPIDHPWRWFTVTDAKDAASCAKQSEAFNDQCNRVNAEFKFMEQPAKECYARLPTGCQVSMRKRPTPHFGSP
jgi:hypothetical protein